MTSQKLNIDIKRLNKLVSETYSGDLSDQDIYNKLEVTIKKEFLRLYDADNKFEYMNKSSVLIMFRLNLRFRFVALHTFGLHLNLEEL